MCIVICHICVNFNPRPPRGGRRFAAISVPISTKISIHALREEGDPRGERNRPPPPNFNPRPPRGGRPTAGRWIPPSAGFQSTPSARRATRVQSCGCIRAEISIHALREEGDSVFFFSFSLQKHFNPRPPRGGRPSILIDCTIVVNFNPRPPRGGRQQIPVSKFPSLTFQSTPSARRATNLRFWFSACRVISIHALREEGDPAPQVFLTHWKNFNPRPPRGGRRPKRERINPSATFQSTPSARRATLCGRRF